MPLSTDKLDEILTYQLAVAWAGEAGDEPRRLGWWKTDMVSRYGGLALFEQLAPQTRAWAAFEVAREAARRVDEAARNKSADPDRLLSVFHLGADLDEQVQERIGDHKRDGRSPTDALPELQDLIAGWDRERFEAWLAAQMRRRPPMIRADAALHRRALPIPLSACEPWRGHSPRSPTHTRVPTTAMDARASEVTAFYTRLLRVTLEAEHSRANWLHARPAAGTWPRRPRSSPASRGR